MSRAAASPARRARAAGWATTRWSSGTGTRNGAGTRPALEEDIALANIALDLIGQTQLWLGLAAEAEGKGRTADDLAFLRDAGDFRNLLLVEQPNGDFGRTHDAAVPVRCLASADAEGAGGLDRPARRRDRREGRQGGGLSSGAQLRPGDPPRRRDRREPRADAGGARLALALHGRDVPRRRRRRRARRRRHRAGSREPARRPGTRMSTRTLADATLRAAGEGASCRRAASADVHSEHLGFILAEMQFLQRAYPGASW